MVDEHRLQRALAAQTAPARDLQFTLAVLRRAEAERYRTEAVQRMLRGAGLAALAAAGALAVVGWLAENVDLASDVLLAAGALAAVTALARGFRGHAALQRA